MSRAPIVLFYGSSTCYTEMAAEKICQQLGENLVDCFNVADEPIFTAQFYDFIILGIPTWDYGELQEDWEEAWSDIDDLNLTGKNVALFGLGDQIGYPEWFLDAMGYLHAKVVRLGANTVGYCPIAGFEFESSKALTADGNEFLGLALDDENQFELTDDRIRQWCLRLQQDFNFPCT